MTKQILYKNCFHSNLAYCGQCVICITIFFYILPPPFCCCSFSLINHFLFMYCFYKLHYKYTVFCILYSAHFTIPVSTSRANRIMQGHANTFPAKIPLQNASKLGRRLTYKFVINTCTLFVTK